MASKTRRILLGALVAVAALVALDYVYQLGYRRGSQDAMDWDFSAVIGRRVVRVGNGASLLRSKLVTRPAQSLNTIATPFGLTPKRP
jgi:hypothetical protein